MAEEITEVGESPTEPKDEAKGLRKQLNAAHADLAAYKERDKERAFQDAGLATDQGLGKAIYKDYTGELTSEAVREYATAEYGWESSTEPTNLAAQHIEQTQQRIDQVSVNSGSIEPPTRQGVLAEAEAEGDYQKTLSMKGQEVAAWFQGPPRR